MPVDVASYMGGRTDERYYGKAKKGTNYRCLWTGPEWCQGRRYLPPPPHPKPRRRLIKDRVATRTQMMHYRPYIIVYSHPE